MRRGALLIAAASLCCCSGRIVKLDLEDQDLNGAQSLIVVFEPDSTVEQPKAFAIDLSGSDKVVLPPIDFQAEDVVVSVLLYPKPLAIDRLAPGPLMEVDPPRNRALPDAASALVTRVHNHQFSGWAKPIALSHGVTDFRIAGGICPRYQQTQVLWRVRGALALFLTTGDGLILGTTRNEVALIPPGGHDLVPLTVVATTSTGQTVSATLTAGDLTSHRSYFGDALGRFATGTVSGDRLEIALKSRADPAIGLLASLSGDAKFSYFGLSASGGLWFFNGDAWSALPAPFHDTGQFGAGQGGVDGPRDLEVFAVHPSSKDVLHRVGDHQTLEHTGEPLGMTVIGGGLAFLAGGLSGEVYTSPSDGVWTPQHVRGAPVRSLGNDAPTLLWGTDRGEVGTFSSATGTCTPFRVFGVPVLHFYPLPSPEAQHEIIVTGAYDPAQGGIPIAFLLNSN